MNRRRVSFTATARRQVLREHAWWNENRQDREVFAHEVEAAIRLISLLPGAGSPYDVADISGLKRVYLERLAAHVYYTFTGDEVIVRALWSARRRREPHLKR